MSRTYTVDGKIYRGFNRDFSTKHDLVVVYVDGEPEIWAIDNSQGFEHLLDFLEDNEPGYIEIFGRYKFEGFIGIICHARVHPDAAKIIAARYK